ncbi:probable mitochondrial pyruvate carrier 1 [Ostrea edulis]|uniref:probable mitochondrial pyruvate carrier 1 n=1 Tax=Ostrea edulis TaxID=37623 RepID=UPI0024AEA02C|nr:probable mitochondrial pyruvate carrier 1 [Ostrea edulis]
MTPALIGYSSAFARFAWMVKPRNLLLLACHLTNITAQVVQGCRYINYHYLTKPEDRRKHHIEVVEKEIHSHPKQYPKVHIKDHPSLTEQVEEVKEFDSAYKLPKETPVIN